MNSRNLIRVSGGVAILAGILNILSAMPGLFSQEALFWVRRIGDISALIALVGIYFHQRRATDTFGVIAFLVAVVGVLMLIFSFPYEQAIMVYGLGVILVAVHLLRSGSIPNWVPGLWLLSVLVALPGFLAPNLEMLLSLLAAISFGLGFVGMGYMLFTLQSI
jgi:hypothetical protein